MEQEKSMSYIMSQIRHICGTYTNRAGGSEAERGCQGHFKSQLEQWSDSVVEEEFTLHPRAFLGWIVPTAASGLAALGLYWAQLYVGGTALAVLSLLLITAALVVMVLEYVFYFRFIDFLLPKKTSSNVFARRSPTGEVRQRIIFGGHADAAYEMTYLTGGDSRRSYRVLYGAIGGLLFVFCINLASLVCVLTGGAVSASGVWLVLGIIGLLFVPFIAASMFFINWSRVVDGANDNLSACLVSMSVLREMEREGIRLENTEVCCLITGAEEEGLRGSMAFAERHREEFSDVETIFVALETLRETDQLQLYLKGINGTQNNSSYVAALLSEAAKNCGLRLGVADNYPGATDAEAFSRAGLLACGLGGVNHEPQPYYHTRYDTADNMSEDCMKKTLEICLETAYLYDERIQEEKLLA